MRYCSKSLLVFVCLLFFTKVEAQTIYSNFKIVENTYNLKLDKTQVLSSAFVQFDEKNNELWRSAKYPKPHLEIIDLKNGKLKNKIFPQTGGCNLFKKITNDKILIQQEDMYAIMDNNGKILKRFKEPLIGDKGSVDLFSGSSNFSPIHFIKNKILITGTIIMLPMKKYDLTAYRKWGILRSFDSNGKMAYYGTIPKQAGSNFYGALNGYSSTENNGKLIIAPHYSNDIQVLDLEKGKTVFYKTFTKYDKLIKPLSSIDKYRNFTLRQANEHFSNSISLIGIVYDKYRDVYYRFVRAPGTSIPFKGSIVVMNNKFKALFYFDIPKDYSPTQFFIDKQGLLIANNKKYKANDNILTFDLFKLTK